MKYPLAIVNTLMDVYGDEVAIELGYDIACEFTKTLGRSSLGPRSERMISGIVPAFHGHSHNRKCQLDWHPLYREGAGKEDFEGCERFFSYTNGLASGTRLSTAFHRHQAIEGAVAHWGDVKHAGSGKSQSFTAKSGQASMLRLPHPVRCTDVSSGSHRAHRPIAHSAEVCTCLRVFGCMFALTCSPARRCGVRLEAPHAWYLHHSQSLPGKFIYNNYRQALKIITDGTRVLEIHERELKTTPADYERYLQEERAYLHALMSEPPEMTLKGEYMDALQKLEEEQ